MTKVVFISAARAAAICGTCFVLAAILAMVADAPVLLKDVSVAFVPFLAFFTGGVVHYMREQRKSRRTPTKTILR